MKKCKNCKINDARYICLECNREFCTFCMKEDEILCSECQFSKREEKEKQQQQQWKEQQQRENQFKLQKNNRNITTNIINIIIASSILLLGIILVLTSYPSLLNFSNISTNDGISSEEKIGNNKNDDRNGFIYIFPFPFAIPLEFNIVYILPLIFIFMIIVPIIFFIIILKSIRIP